MTPGSLAARFIAKARSDGVGPGLRSAVRWLGRKLRSGGVVDAEARRLELSRHFDALFRSTVRYGPFKGLVLGPASWWGASDRASMLFGLYEQEVLRSLQDIPPTCNTLIDLGAADGYYGVGVLVSHLFEKACCFEMSEAGRRVIRSNAELNGVEHRIEIRGTAENGFHRAFTFEQLRRSVLLVDIEGAEFDLLDRDAFHAFRESVILIELHEGFHPDGAERLQRLKSDAMGSHRLSEIRMSGRDLSGFDELRSFTDTDRWLVCSEGRGYLMTWLRLDPLPRAAEDGSVVKSIALED